MKGLSPITPSVLGLLFGVVLIVLVGVSVVLVPAGPTTEAQVVVKNPVKPMAVVTSTPGTITAVPTVAQAVPPTSTAVPPTPAPTASPTVAPVQKYTVAEGDTLGGIAEKFGLSSEEIAQANGITDPQSVVVGKELTIPPKPTPTMAPTRTAAPAQKPTATAVPAPTATAAPTSTPGPTPNATTSVYIVQSGDTLFGITEKVGVSAKAIMDANNLSEDDVLSEGQKLTIPAASAATATAAGPTQAPRVYVVEDGDTLLGIATKLGVDVEAIKRYNGLSDTDTLSIGQSLTIP